MSRAVAGGNCARAFVTTRSMVELRVLVATKTGRSAMTSTVQVRHSWQWFLFLCRNYNKRLTDYAYSSVIGWHVPTTKNGLLGKQNFAYYSCCILVQYFRQCSGINICFNTVDGEWNQWLEWSACSVTCADGTRNRTRVCQQPAYGGMTCPGNDTEVEPCNPRPCPSE